MHDERNELWEAYLDGELCSGEAARFEASLTPAERQRLLADKRLDHAVAKRLSESGECPPEVWARVKFQCEQQAERPDGRDRRLYIGIATLAAAAAVAFVLSLSMANFSAQDEQRIVLAADSVEELRRLSEIDEGHDMAEQYLHERGIALQMVEASILEQRSHHRPITFIGARQQPFAGDTVTEVLFDCCSHPVKIVLAKRKSPAAKALGKAAGQNSHVQATRVIDEYLAAVVSVHPAYDMLGVFATPDDTAH